ncbi:MAG: TIGR03560 family F420-dependent LLM class oxidoreductase [bacterium]
MDIAIMVEGQSGLTWPRWQGLARIVEDLGFAGLYRSDHFTNASPPDLDSLELWTSLAWLASHTRRIAFGPLVTPVSFRHPAMTARMASAVDDLSGGRLVLGLGAGWQAREHANYGFDLLDMRGRFARLREGLEVITRLLRDDGPVSFDGSHFRLREAALLPRPKRPGGPPILIGGNGVRRTLPLAARYAEEWNAVFVPATRFAELNGRLDGLLERRGRRPTEVRRSLMTGLVFGRDDAEVQGNLRGQSEEALRERGVIIGTAAAVTDALGQLADAGVQRVMLQWLELDNLDALEALAGAVTPWL